MKIGIVSGYFNPLHAGHIEYINGAKSICDKLIVIINSDYQRKLKGTREFMSESHRSIIISSLKSVDETMISIDKDKSQCESIRFIRNKYPLDELLFINSGDRKGSNLESSESVVCKELKILEIILDLPKIYSSSELLKKL